MKPPQFWEKRGIPARVLAPFGLVTRIATARRVARPGYDAGIPVYCVGNAGVGGAGKTILARDLLGRLQDRPFALTRGYGGGLSGPVLVDGRRHAAADVGDEALLLAATAPTVVARDRARGARFAVARGASAIVMDDGLQNPGLAKTLSLLVIDGGYGFGNGLLLPAGPLREPVAAAAGRCAAAVLIGEDISGAVAMLPAGMTVLRASLAPDCVVPLRGRPVLAFAGIGRPEKFFTTLRGMGAVILRQVGFADHHVYRDTDAARLLSMAAAAGALLVTTEKDFVKLPEALRARVAVVTVTLAWEDETAVAALF